MGFSDKSDIIEKGKNLLVVRNKGKTSHTLTIELSGVSKSFFSHYISSPVGSDSNLLLTTKTVQSCLRDYYISCDGATSETAFNIPLNTAFKIIINEVEYYFTDIDDYLLRAKSILPVQTDVMVLEALCEHATQEAGITLEPNNPFKLTIDGEDHFFSNVQELIDRTSEFPTLDIVPFVHLSEIPVNVFDLKTSRNYPILLKESFELTSSVVTEAQKHLLLSPNIDENITVGSYTFNDAYIRVDGEKLLVDTINNVIDLNHVKTQYKANDVVIKSPLREQETTTEEYSITYKVLDPMLRDNLILGSSNKEDMIVSHKVNDVRITKDIHDAYVTDQIDVNKFKLLDPEIREHAYEVYDVLSNNVTIAATVRDATTRDMLVISKDDINSVSFTSKILEPTIRDHVVVSTSPVDNITTTHTVLDPVMKADLKNTETLEELKTTPKILEPVLSFTRHENFDTINSVTTNFSIFEPVITGDTIVPIECSGALSRTKEITFNGKFNVLLDNVKLNSQAMTIEEIKVLLANYNIRIDITT